MDTKELKQEIKHVKLFLFSILARNSKYLITTGTSTIYITNIDPNKVIINDVGMDGVVSKVTYRDFDMLCKHIPILKIPNLCIRRDIVATIYNKATQGKSITIKDDTYQSWSKDSLIESGIDSEYMRYKFVEKDRITYAEGLDKDLNKITTKINKVIFDFIPIAYYLSEALVKWYTEVCDVDIENLYPKKIRRPGRQNMWWENVRKGLTVPYVDGVIGISIGGFISKLDKKDVDNHYVNGYLKDVSGYKYIVTGRELDSVSVITVPKIFKLFPF